LDAILRPNAPTKGNGSEADSSKPLYLNLNLIGAIGFEPTIPQGGIMSPMVESAEWAAPSF